MTNIYEIQHLVQYYLSKQNPRESHFNCKVSVFIQNEELYYTNVPVSHYKYLYNDLKNIPGVDRVMIQVLHPQGS